MPPSPDSLPHGSGSVDLGGQRGVMAAASIGRLLRARASRVDSSAASSRRFGPRFEAVTVHGPVIASVSVAVTVMVPSALADRTMTRFGTGRAGKARGTRTARRPSRRRLLATNGPSRMSTPDAIALSTSSARWPSDDQKARSASARSTEISSAGAVQPEGPPASRPTVRPPPGRRRSPFPRCR